jgi:mRNA interferase MazF
VRGDLYRLKSDRRASGHEQRGARYCVVVQTDALRRSTVLVAPTSTSARAFILRPVVEIDGTETRVIVEQTMCVDLNRLGDFAGRLSPEEMAEVDQALRYVFGLY